MATGVTRSLRESGSSNGKAPQPPGLTNNPLLTPSALAQLERWLVFLQAKVQEPVSTPSDQQGFSFYLNTEICSSETCRRLQVEQGEVKKHHAAKPGLRLELLPAAPRSCEFTGSWGKVFLENSLGKLISYQPPQPSAIALNRTKTTRVNPPPPEPFWSSLV